MTISDTEKLDFLWKKVIFGTAKTAGSTVKSGSNETIPSPLPVYAGNVWTQADPGNIPVVPPASTTSVVTKYYAATRIQLTMDPTSPANVTWLAGSGNFIPTTFGSGYLVRVWLGDPNVGPAARIFPDTTGEEYVFDYVSGSLNFTGTIPAGKPATIGSGNVGVAANGVYIEVYKYTGSTLDTALAGETTTKSSVVADIPARNAITGMHAGDIVYVVDASGIPSDAASGQYATYMWTGAAWVVTATEASARSDALTQSVNVSYLDFTGAPDLIGNVGNGTRVVEVSVQVLQAFNTGTEITIGDATVNDRLLANSEVDLQTVGNYVVSPIYQFPAGSNVDVNVYYSGLPNFGNAVVTITWA